MKPVSWRIGTNKGGSPKKKKKKKKKKERKRAHLEEIQFILAPSHFLLKLMLV